MYLFMSVWNSTYHAEANIQWFTQHKSVIIVEKKSEDLIFSSCPSFIVWSWAHHSSFLKLSFLICETKTQLEGCSETSILKRHDHDIDDH